MKFNLLSAGLLFSAVLLQETLMGQLQIWHARADLVLIMIVGWSFLLPPTPLDTLVFLTGLLQGLIELPVTGSLGLYPLSYLCISIPLSRLLASHVPPALIYRLPAFIAAFVLQRLIGLLARLLLDPINLSLSKGTLLLLAEAGYTTIIWVLCAVFFFHPLEARRRL